MPVTRDDFVGTYTLRNGMTHNPGGLVVGDRMVVTPATGEGVEVTFERSGQAIWPTTGWTFSSQDQCIAYHGATGEHEVPYTAQFSLYVDGNYRNVYGVVIVGDPVGAGVWSGGPDDPSSPTLPTPDCRPGAPGRSPRWGEG
jgi:hypothetical protein